MRRLVPVMGVVLAVCLFGEVVYYMTRHPAMGIEPANDNTNQVQPVVVVKKKLGPTKKDTTERPQANWDAAATLPAPPLKMVVPPLNLAARPDAITTGMPKDQLESSFGEPVLKIATSGQRELQEVYVFTGQERDKVTVTQLSNGVVTEAYARKH